MKLSTFGMWEKPRLDLTHSLKDSLNYDIEQINNALLENVITKIHETAYLHHQTLQQEKSPLSLKENTLSGYIVSLATMLPTLAKTLGQSEELLHPHVEKFIAEALSIAEKSMDYLMKLAGISRESRINGCAEL